MDLIIRNLNKEAAEVIRYIAEKDGAIIEKKASAKTLKEDEEDDQLARHTKHLHNIINKRLKDAKISAK